MTYFFTERNFFSEQYKIELNEKDFILSKCLSKNREEILSQIAYEHIDNIHLQAIERNQDNNESAFIECCCVITTANLPKEIIILGDNSYSYTVFLNYLHAYCDELPLIRYTYEANYRIEKLNKNIKIKNNINILSFILFVISIVIGVFNFYMALVALILALISMLLSTILDTGTESFVSNGIYERNHRPDFLLF
jgi:hypothetical protein